jgi:hypothetical protein
VNLWNGYVVVHYFRYMKRAVDYALQLSPHEIEGLMRSLNGHEKILELDETAPVRVNVRPHEVIAGGREVAGLARGPAYQVFWSDGSFRFTSFVLNPDFRETKFVIVDVVRAKT